MQQDRTTRRNQALASRGSERDSENATSRERGRTTQRVEKRHGSEDLITDRMLTVMQKVNGLLNEVPPSVVLFMLSRVTRHALCNGPNDKINRLGRKISKEMKRAGRRVFNFEDAMVTTQCSRDGYGFSIQHESIEDVESNRSVGESADNIIELLLNFMGDANNVDYKVTDDQQQLMRVYIEQMIEDGWKPTENELKSLAFKKTINGIQQYEGGRALSRVIQDVEKGDVESRARSRRSCDEERDQVGSEA